MHANPSRDAAGERQADLFETIRNESKGAEDAAFEELCEGLLFGLAHNVAASFPSELHDDVVQEILLEFTRAIRRAGETPHMVGSWARTVAFRTALRHVRSHRARPTPVTDKVLAAARVDHVLDLTAVEVGVELSAALAVATEVEPVGTALLVLTCVDGCTQAELAEPNGMTPKQVSRAVNRSMAVLATELG